MTQEATEPWTIKRLLAWTADYLGKKGAESPRLDAEVLLATSLDCKRIDLYARFADVPESEQLTEFRDKVKRRAEGNPVAYLVGFREFFSMRFEVTEDVLIPRPETEFVVLEAIDFCRQRALSGSPVPNAIDIGTGSGCIAVALAHHIPDVDFHAVDLSEPALEVARRNAEAHQVAERITFLHSDLFENVPSDLKFDLIVSNPPYIGRDEQGTVDPHVHRFEPELALYAGADGMEVIQRLVAAATERLRPGGHMFWELSPFIAEACEKLISDTPELEWLGLVKDLDANARVAKVKRL